MQTIKWQYHNVSQSAKDAYCIGHSFEVGSGGCKSVSCALTWYFKVNVCSCHLLIELAMVLCPDGGNAFASLVQLSVSVHVVCVSPACQSQTLSVCILDTPSHVKLQQQQLHELDCMVHGGKDTVVEFIHAAPSCA